MFIAENKAAEVLETKSHGASFGSSISFPEFLLNGGNAALSAFATILLYEQAMPFFNAVDMRATAFSQIPLRVYDLKKQEFLKDHPVLELIKAPNADVSQLEFLHAYSSFYDITGEAFLVATGRTERPPLELINLSPAFTVFGQNNPDFGLLNIPAHITIESRNMTERIFESVDDKGRLRFMNTRRDQELWHSRAFNPRRTAGLYRGLSKAQPLWLEIQQYVSGNRTNLSNLKRGTRLSMAWVNTGETELTPVQWERMQEEAQKYAGEMNAGGTPILDGMDVKTIQQTNREMEFQKLQDAMLSRISTTYGIPLALLLDASMTMSNLEVALLHFYDIAVLPHAMRLYNELTRFLLPRYPNSENLEFRFNENDISAIRARIVMSAKNQNAVGVNSIDEIREILGDEPVTGGAVILAPSTLIPIATTDGSELPTTPDDTPAPLPAEEEEQLVGTAAAYRDFCDLMTKVKKSNGDQKYTTDEILEIAMQRGLIGGD